MGRKCNPNSQKNFVINHLDRYKKITSMEAFRNYGITRLSSIVYNLRNEGYDIKTDIKKSKSSISGETCVYAEYILN